MPTYFLPYITDADDAADAVAPFVGMDPPEPTTIDELRALLNIVFDSYNRDREWAAKDGKRTEAAKETAVARIMQIVTLGSVLA